MMDARKMQSSMNNFFSAGDNMTADDRDDCNSVDQVMDFDVEIGTYNNGPTHQKRPSTTMNHYVNSKLRGNLLSNQN